MPVGQSYSNGQIAEDGPVSGGRFCRPVDISVIIPVYNVGQPLENALRSLSQQTFRNWEALCVDDGSLDTSAEKLTDFVRRDVRARVIFKRNGGVSSARNRGVCSARGEYLFFLDADDGLTVGCLEALFRVATQSHADIVVAETERVFSIGTELIRRRTAERFFVVERMHFTEFGASLAMYVVWGKLIRKKVFDNNGLLFDETLPVGEDTLLGMLLMLYVPRIAVMEGGGAYLYRRPFGRDSLMTRGRQAYLRAGCLIVKRMRAEGLRDPLAARLAEGEIRALCWRMTVMVWPRKAVVKAMRQLRPLEGWRPKSIVERVCCSHLCLALPVAVWAVLCLVLNFKGILNYHFFWPLKAYAELRKHDDGACKHGLAKGRKTCKSVEE